MKTKNIFLTFALGLFTTFAFSQFTSKLMTETTTAHNFATGTGLGAGGAGYTFAASTIAGDGNGVCAVCHTPHNATSTDLPLWDHETSGTTFTPYPSGGTIQGTITAPSGASQLCLGCHDGTANLDAYGKSASPAGTISMNAGDLAYASFGADLTNDHPISITYPADATASAEQMKLASSLPAGMLYTNKVECASCHGMHNPAVTSKLLRVSNDNSALCLTCHVK
ncbi:MAG: cytochrome c3 family protein [Vicingaceae bacterium]|nr:cytochrome c3 family protein [Vicingaceae bacterium]